MMRKLIPHTVARWVDEDDNGTTSPLAIEPSGAKSVSPKSSLAVHPAGVDGVGGGGGGGGGGDSHSQRSAVKLSGKISASSTAGKNTFKRVGTATSKLIGGAKAKAAATAEKEEVRRKGTAGTFIAVGGGGSEGRGGGLSDSQLDVLAARMEASIERRFKALAADLGGAMKEQGGMIQNVLQGQQTASEQVRRLEKVVSNIKQVDKRPQLFI
jgi:hypothetical protein